MGEIRMLPGGRYGVFADGRHQESFEGSLGAIVVAEAAAGELVIEPQAPVSIAAPRSTHFVSTST